MVAVLGVEVCGTLSDTLAVIADLRLVFCVLVAFRKLLDYLIVIIGDSTRWNNQLRYIRPLSYTIDLLLNNLMYRLSLPYRRYLTIILSYIIIIFNPACLLSYWLNKYLTQIIINLSFIIISFLNFLIISLDLVIHYHNVTFL